MSNTVPVSLRQASRLYSRRLNQSSWSPRNSPHRFCAPISHIPRRSYVSESKPDKAQISVDTTIQADHKAFLAQTGKLPEDVKVPGTQMSADALMSPAAGILKQASIMDEGARPIYLDMQATTPTDPRVLDAMLPFLTGLYGNPHSRTHAYGWETETATEQAREHVANIIGADSKEIIFTSGATESNNMSIKGVARFFGRSGKKKHIITSQTEHKCVLDSCRHLQEEGFEVTYLPVQSNGLIDLKQLKEAMRPDTALVSIMTVNNEIGVIQPMEEIGKMCRENKTFFHTDAAQAVGKIPVDVNKWNVDLMSISGHKVYGPKGVGACYVRRRPRVRLDPIISGGGQERGLRSGTLAPHLVVGFGEACRICKEEMTVSSKPPFPPFNCLSIRHDYILLYMHGFKSAFATMSSRRRGYKCRGYDCPIKHLLALTNLPLILHYMLTTFQPLVRLRPHYLPLQSPPHRPPLHGTHHPKRLPRPLLPRLRQRLLRLRGRRIPPHGPQGHCPLLRQCLHFRLAGTQLRAPCPG